MTEGTKTRDGRKRSVAELPPYRPGTGELRRKAGREGRPRGAKKAERAQELARELAALRDVTNDIHERWLVRIHGIIAELGRSVEGDREGAPVVAPDARKAEAMLEEIRDLRVKPHKARAKDLQKIERTLEALRMMLPPQP